MQRQIKREVAAKKRKQQDELPERDADREPDAVFSRRKHATTLAANAARSYALYPGTPASLGGAMAWVGGILAVFVPLSVWRYRRMS